MACGCSRWLWWWMVAHNDTMWPPDTVAHGMTVGMVETPTSDNPPAHPARSSSSPKQAWVGSASGPPFVSTVHVRSGTISNVSCTLINTPCC
jgi:hypothetical protein